MSLPLLSPRLRRRVAFALVLGAIGCGGTGLKCCTPPKPDGLYIMCEGENAGLYWISNAGKKLDEVTFCLDDRFLNETGAGGTEGEIDLVKWINDPEDIETLQKMCVAKCEEITNTGGRCSGQGLKWDIQNYKG